MLLQGSQPAPRRGGGTGRGGEARAAGGAVRGGTRTLTWAPLTTSPAMAEGGSGRCSAGGGGSGLGWAHAATRAATSSRQSADTGGSSAAGGGGGRAGSRRHLRPLCSRPAPPAGEALPRVSGTGSPAGRQGEPAGRERGSGPLRLALGRGLAARGNPGWWARARTGPGHELCKGLSGVQRQVGFPSF